MKEVGGQNLQTSPPILGPADFTDLGRISPANCTGGLRLLGQKSNPGLDDASLQVKVTFMDKILIKPNKLGVI